MDKFVQIYSNIPFTIIQKIFKESTRDQIISNKLITIIIYIFISYYDIIFLMILPFWHTTGIKSHKR